MPPKEQIFIGTATAALCVFGLANSRWILENTKKGARLCRWFGPTRAIWVLRGLLGLGAIFGGLLAADFIRPLQW
jgi:hypothetical protein